MKKDHIPLRKCVGCGQRKPKDEFIRLVREPSETSDKIKPMAVIDFCGKKAGRGAYVCKDYQCIKSAKKARRFERHLSCRLDEDIYKTLEEAALKTSG